ncbi:MAG: YajQ family cyclic di-GMP-binding protein [Gammaproteobacteria bacterium]
MPSFDVVSQVDLHELTNAVDQANREIANRFDFKGTSAHIERGDNELTLIADAEFQVRQIEDILRKKLAARSIDAGCLELSEISQSGREARQTAKIRQGIDKELAKKIVKLIKESKLKVQSQIQGDQVRVSGKKRDDLQQVIALLREAKLDLPLQFENFRD